MAQILPPQNKQANKQNSDSNAGFGGKLLEDRNGANMIARQEVLLRLGLAEWPKQFERRKPDSIMNRIMSVESAGMKPGDITLNTYTLRDEKFTKRTAQHQKLLEIRKKFESKGADWIYSVKCPDIDELGEKIEILDAGNFPYKRGYLRMPLDRLRNYVGEGRKYKQTHIFSKEQLQKKAQEENERLDFLRAYGKENVAQLRGVSLKKIKEMIPLFIDAKVPIIWCILDKSEKTIRERIGGYVRRREIGAADEKDKMSLLRVYSKENVAVLRRVSLKKLRKNISLFTDAKVPIIWSALHLSEKSIRRRISRSLGKRGKENREKKELSEFLREREIDYEDVPEYIRKNFSARRIIEKIRKIESDVGRRFRNEWYHINAGKPEFEKFVGRAIRMETREIDRNEALRELNEMCDKRDIRYRPNYIFSGTQNHPGLRLNPRKIIRLIKNIESKTEARFSGHWALILKYSSSPKKLVSLYPEAWKRFEDTKARKIEKLKSLNLTEEQIREYVPVTLGRMEEIEETFASAELDPKQYTEEFIALLSAKESYLINRIHDDRIKDIIGDKLSALMGIDVESLYSGQVSGFPMLSHEETIGLFGELKKGNLKVKNVLVLANLRLVSNLAKKAMRRGRNAQALDFFDLVQEGNRKLLSIIDKFDTSRGYKFSTFAYTGLKNHFKLLFDRDSEVPPSHLLLKRKIYEFIGRFSDEFGRKPRISEITRELNMTSQFKTKIITESEVRLVMQGSGKTSLDKKIGEDEENTILDILPHSGDAEAGSEMAAITDASRFRKTISEELSRFDPRTKKMMLMKWGLEDGIAKTLEEVGKRFGLTRERIRQIEKKCIKKIKKSKRLLECAKDR